MEQTHLARSFKAVLSTDNKFNWWNQEV